MIITAYGMIIFQLVDWIGFDNSHLSVDRENGNDMLGFAFQAIPSRHEVPGKTLLADDN
jgi:hypothetical protein